MGVRSRSKRRRRASAGGADRISALCDDVLVRILELLPDAGDAVRTGALSRRWRGLWTRVGSLRFDSSSRPRLESDGSDQSFLDFDSSSRQQLESASSDERFLGFVNDVLAQRAKTDAALDLEHLAISFAISMSHADFFLREPDDLRPIQRCADAAQEWICYAMEKRVKSFLLKLRLFTIWKPCPPREIGAGTYDLVARYQVEQPVINLNDLPSSEKLETLHWDLKDVMVQLPDAAVFASLVDLSLENVDLGVGNGHLLARFLSSACCPSLQKLQLRNLILHYLLKELLIEAGALLQLTMSSASVMAGPVALKLKTPSLQILHLENFDHHGMRVGIFAPKLEELTFLPKPPDHIEVDGELPCVERLKVINLFQDEHDVKDSSICLLSRCTSVTCLEVSLKVTMGEGSVENITKRIPHLPHLISLTVHIYSRKLHSFGVGLAEILKQCNHFKYLRVHCIHEAGHNNDSFCDHPDHWKSHQVYLDNIKEAEFTGLVGIECESWFMKRALAHTIQLQKVSLSFDPTFRLQNKIDDSMFVPCSGGRWICHDPGLSYEWNPGPIHK